MIKKDTAPKIDPELANTAVYANTYKSMNLGVKSTGFRTNSLRYSTLSHSNVSRIAENFLINTTLVRNDPETESSVASYFFDPGVVMLSMLGEEEDKGYGELCLPESMDLQMELGEAIRRRRSSRMYTGDPMRFNYLATLIRCASGITCYTEVMLRGGGKATLRFRTTPSAGGLYPIDLYIAALNVTDLKKGIYKYNPIKDIIIQTGDHSAMEDLLKCFAISEEIISLNRANIIFLLVGQPWRSMRKYGKRAMRYLFLEAGEIAQNIHLVTAALGFGSVDCAGIYDDEAHEVLNIDGLFQSLLHTIIIGNPG